MTGAVTGGVVQGPVGDSTDPLSFGSAAVAALGMEDLADIEPIGSSLTGVLYAATDLKLERRVAVRVLHPLAVEADRVRFARESKLLGGLSAHPNVVTVYDAGFTADGRPFLVMELVDGGDLGSLLARHGPLAWEAAADLAIQICAGLQPAHRSGALHRDLRPDNILLAGVTPKLTDFGIGTIGVTATPNGLTGDQTGASAAKRLLHRAPETFNGLWDERTDLYSVASILYELIDGHPPFWRPGEDSPDALRLRLIHQTAAGLEPDTVPAALDVFIAAALSKDPFDRPQTAEEFAHELQLIRDGRTTGSNPSVLHGSTGAMAGVLPLPTGAGSSPPLETAEHPVGVGEPLLASFASPAPAPPVPAPAQTPWTAPDSVPPSAGFDAGTTVYDFAPPPSPVQVPGPNAVGGPLGDVRINDSAPVDGFVDGGYYDGPESAQPQPATAFEPVRRRSGANSSGSSTAFMAAMAMIALGVIGLAAIVAYSALSSNDNDGAAPVLPDPNEPSTSEAVGGAVAAPTTGGPEIDAMAQDMEDATEQDTENEAAETTVTTAQPMSTTESTIPRLAVPDMVGRPVQEAARRLADAGFEVLIIGRQDRTAQPGTVTLQKPDAGSVVTLPLTVTLYIPKVANLPSMVGRSADAVCLELQALTLTCNRTMRNDPRVPAGSVISTDPAAGARFDEGSTVNVVVSRGPVTTVAVPQVTGQSRTEAEATLRAAGFTVISTAAQPSDSVPVDQVIGTNPAAGTSLATDQPLTILVSNGPPAKATVPQLVGLARAEAESRLASSGLAVTVVEQDRPAGDPGIGMVLAQDPAADSEVNAGSAVTITVGREQAAESTTTTAEP